MHLNLGNEILVVISLSYYFKVEKFLFIVMMPTTEQDKDRLPLRGPGLPQMTFSVGHLAAFRTRRSLQWFNRRGLSLLVNSLTLKPISHYILSVGQRDLECSLDT